MTINVIDIFTLKKSTVRIVYPNPKLTILIIHIRNKPRTNSNF